MQFLNLAFQNTPFLRSICSLQTDAPRRVVLLAVGSFSPITRAHVHMFVGAKQWLRVNRPDTEVLGGILSPVSKTYAKKGLADTRHRLRMAEAAVRDSGHQWIRVDDWEAKRSEWTRTAVVIRHHREEVKMQYGDDVEVLLLAGGDLIDSILRPGLWADADVEEIVRPGLLCVARPGVDERAAIRKHAVLSRYNSVIVILPPNPDTQNISSTRIRTLLEEDADDAQLRKLTYASVVKYIRKHPNIFKDV